jgi:glycosyltransferase involved in cell wall biosynthesis
MSGTSTNAAESRRPRVSLCMIVKNEEAHLRDCLRSVRDLVDEIVIADTGSTDATKAIAREFDAVVVDFVWEDSFAAARNASLQPATGAWIFWMDADERLDEVNRRRLRGLFSRLGSENVGYAMRQSSPLSAAPHAAAYVDQVRLFPRHPTLRWAHRVHEQILPGLRALGADVSPTDIVIDHVGFAEPEAQGPKVDRNLRLLELEIQEHPNDSFVVYNLGSVALTQGKLDKALQCFNRCLELPPIETLRPKVYALWPEARSLGIVSAGPFRICGRP